MNLKQLMYFKEKNGYTFEQLSELSGVPVGTIQKIFSGETRTPRHKTIQALEMIMKFEEKDEDSGYRSGGSHNDVVCEPATAYKTRQGSYTLDDYFATPENVRVELIDGVIYDMGMPIRCISILSRRSVMRFTVISEKKADIVWYFRFRPEFRSTVMTAPCWCRIFEQIRQMWPEEE